MKKEKLLVEGVKFGAMLSLMMLALPSVGVAAETEGTIAQIIDRTSETQVSPFAVLISAVCYVAGAVMLASGALSLRKHADNPASESVSKGVARLVVGGCFMGLPYLSGVLQQTVFGDASTAATYTNFKF
ncbi:MAG: hypothetical protein AB7E52_09685 [Bdellovibrionales bacterium]